jgi:hypothetical protein
MPRLDILSVQGLEVYMLAPDGVCFERPAGTIAVGVVMGLVVKPGLGVAGGL